MKRMLLIFVCAMAHSTASHAQSCLMQGTVFGKPVKECLTNESLAKDAFDALCTAWDKHPVSGIESKTTYPASCPAGYAGFCVSTFTGSSASMRHYFYDKAIVARAKKSCGAQNPLTSGVWHDQ